MKKILSLFLMILLIPSFVKADDEIDSCYNDFLINTNDLIVNNSSSYYNSSTDSWSSSTVRLDYTLKYLFTAEPSKKYYLRFFKGISSLDIVYFYLYDSNKNVIDSTSAFVNKDITNYLTYNYDSSNYILTIEFKDNINFNYISFVFNRSLSTFAYADFDLSTCPEIVKPENPSLDPTAPDLATPQESDQNKIISNFYTLFLDKLKFINDYTLKNPIFLYFFGTFITFMVLELFLYLYNRGGGYR